MNTTEKLSQKVASKWTFILLCEAIVTFTNTLVNVIVHNILVFKAQCRI